MSSTFTSNIVLTLFGESHGPAVGCVLDGFPPGFAPDLPRLAAFLARRAPGSAPGSTPRRETDAPEILSGLHQGRTTGSPIAAVFRNADTHSSDYSLLATTPRPGHADYPLAVKTGRANDPRGGGHSSGRLTVGVCFAGALALQYLATKGVSVSSRIAAVAGAPVDGPVDASGLDAPARDAIQAARAAGDSVGGIVEASIAGLPAGLGAPPFGGVENRLSAALFAIPAVKGVEFGDGFAAAALRGSQHNDPFQIAPDGAVTTPTNHHGGILGGLTTGLPVTFRVAFKPTPSIALPQRSVNLDTLQNAPLSVPGRHDACIVPRARPVVEAVAALVALDLLLDPPPKGLPHDS